MPEGPSDRQEILVANCVDLWVAGELKLKPLAAHYRTVIARVSAAETLSGALWRSDVIGGPYGPARGAWEFLAETTVMMLRETAENLEATGDALVMASEVYEETENVNAAAIRDQKHVVVSAQRNATGSATAPDGESR